MKLIIIVVCLIFANVAGAESNVFVSMESIYRSKYISSSGDIISKTPVQQTDLFISFQEGLWIDVGGSFDWKGQETEGG